jgi:uncharacterized protein YjbI with pentapeptide repeats
VSGGIIALAIFRAESVRDYHARLDSDRQGFLLQLALQQNLMGVDLHGKDLSGISMRYKDLRNANFRYANLAGVDFTGADLRGATMKYADLVDAKLNSADLRLSVLAGANLSGAEMIFVNAQGASFDGAVMHCVAANGGDFSSLQKVEVDELTSLGIDIYGTPSKLIRIGTYGEIKTKLTSVKAWRSTWQGCNFSGTNMSEADLRYSRYGDSRENSSTQDWDIPVPGIRALWKEKILRKHGHENFYVLALRKPATFEQADLRRAKLDFSEIAGVDFSSALTDGLTLDGCSVKMVAN